MKYVRTSVDNHIEKMIREFPELFQNRTSVMQNMFCMIGTFYRWRNGRLVAPPPSAYMRNDSDIYAPMIERARLHQKEAESQEIARFYEEEIARYITEREIKAVKIVTVASLAHELALVDLDSDSKKQMWINPLYPEAPLCNVPDDVKPDWLKAALDMIGLIFSVSQESNKSTTPDHHQRNIAQADLVLQDLTKRFGKPYEKSPGSYAEWQERRKITGSAGVKAVLSVLRGEKDRKEAMEDYDKDTQ